MSRFHSKAEILGVGIFSTLVKEKKPQTVESLTKEISTMGHLRHAHPMYPQKCYRVSSQRSGSVLLPPSWCITGIDLLSWSPHPAGNKALQGPPRSTYYNSGKLTPDSEMTILAIISTKHFRIMCNLYRKLPALRFDAFPQRLSHGSRSSREIMIKNASCQMGGREVTGR